MWKIILKRLLIGTVGLIVVIIISHVMSIDTINSLFFISFVSLVIGLLASGDNFESRTTKMPTGYKDFYQESDYERGVVSHRTSTLHLIINYFLPCYVATIWLMFL